MCLACQRALSQTVSMAPALQEVHGVVEDQVNRSVTARQVSTDPEERGRILREHVESRGLKDEETLQGHGQKDREEGVPRRLFDEEDSREQVPRSAPWVLARKW